MPAGFEQLRALQESLECIPERRGPGLPAKLTSPRLHFDRFSTSRAGDGFRLGGRNDSGRQAVSLVIPAPLSVIPAQAGIQGRGPRPSAVLTSPRSYFHRPSTSGAGPRLTISPVNDSFLTRKLEV